MTKKKLAELLSGFGKVSTAAENYSSTVTRLNPANWNFNREADALMDLLKALETEGYIEIKR